MSCSKHWRVYKFLAKPHNHVKLILWKHTDGGLETSPFTKKKTWISKKCYGLFAKETFQASKINKFVIVQRIKYRVNFHPGWKPLKSFYFSASVPNGSVPMKTETRKGGGFEMAMTKGQHEQYQKQYDGVTIAGIIRVFYVVIRFPWKNVLIRKVF